MQYFLHVHYSVKLPVNEAFFFFFFALSMDVVGAKIAGNFTSRLQHSDLDNNYKWKA